MKQKDYAYRSDVPHLRKCLDYEVKSMEIYKELMKDNKRKYKVLPVN